MACRVPKWKRVKPGDVANGIPATSRAMRTAYSDTYDYLVAVKCEDCDNDRWVNVYAWLNGKVSRRCSACAARRRRGTGKLSKVKAGDRFGAWLVLTDAEARNVVYSSGYHETRWECRVRCDCGRERIVKCHNLVYGKSTQCNACEMAKLHAQSCARGCSVRVE